MKLSKEQKLARYEAFVEAAGHLRLTWTDDPIEIKEGFEIADWLEGHALKWLKKANADKKENQ